MITVHRHSNHALDWRKALERNTVSTNTEHVFSKPEKTMKRRGGGEGGEDLAEGNLYGKTQRGKQTAFLRTTERRGMRPERETGQIRGPFSAKQRKLTFSQMLELYIIYFHQILFIEQYAASFQSSLDVWQGPFKVNSIGEGEREEEIQ